VWFGFAEVRAVILINLLPHREAARKARRDVFNVSLVVSVMLGGLIAGGVYAWYEAAIAAQQRTNSVLSSEITRLEAQIKEILNLEAEIAALRARQQAVEDLQSDRNLPVHLLVELTKQLPDGLYITKMAQLEQSVTLTGTAQSNQRVSEFLYNLANNTPWFSKPELVEIVSGNVTLPTKEQRRVANFSIQVRLVRSSEAEKVAKLSASASGAAAASAVGSK
jgi:type IV pilus assembly protein PilN